MYFPVKISHFLENGGIWMINNNNNSLFAQYIHPCGPSIYKYKQTKHRKLQFDHNNIIGYTK